MKKILIIEDNPDIQLQIKNGLSKEYLVLQANNRTEATHLFKKNLPRVVVLDLGLPPEENGSSEGFLCLHQMLQKASETKVIVITGNGKRENALKAINMGAHDYYHKPVDVSELKVIVNRAFYLYEIESEKRMSNKMSSRNIGFSGMIGQSEEMNSVFEIINKVSPTEATVMITGESGTGKELVAKAIHDKSFRSKGPFIAINCAAIPDQLLESELFGHERGAFTGADSQRRGKFEYADKGTLFLDEIGEMSKRLQAKLLRFLQEKKIQRVGGREDMYIDTRVLTATNLDLYDEVKNGAFREDVFFRISTISINVPPLRDRGYDITLLVNSFLERYNELYKKKIKGLSNAAYNAFQKYAWPGNVRELENKLQEAVIIADSTILDINNLGFMKLPDMENNGKHDKRYEGIPLKEARRRLDMDLVGSALAKHQGNIRRASQELGVSRPTLYDIIGKYKIQLRDLAK